MPYAIKDKSFRCIGSENDLMDGEILAINQPSINQVISLSPSQQIILADGVDVARVTITGNPNDIVDYTINGEPVTTDLDGLGIDVIELTCDTPNTTLVVQAGTAKAVVYAVEVPS